MVTAAVAAIAIAVRGDLQAERDGPEMRHLTKKIDGSFRIAALELAIRGAHAAEGLNAALGANCVARGFGAADLQAAFPALLEGARAKLVTVTMRKDTDGHAAIRVNGAAVVTAAAGVLCVAGGGIGSEFGFREASVFGSAYGVAEIEVDYLPPDSNAPPEDSEAIRSRVDEGIELERDAEVLLGEALHFVDFMVIDGGWYGFEFQW